MATLPVSANLSTLAAGLDKGWIITSAGFVFIMQIGLGLMEIGSIRRKHSRIVWYKILLNLIFTFFWWYLLGFAWAFGLSESDFIGAERLYAGDLWDVPNQESLGLPANNTSFSRYVWYVAIASVAVTIATAIVSERVTMRAVSLFNMGFNLAVLPFIFAWTFGLGFLIDDIGYIDYAGSFIVFGPGAVAGLIGLLFIGTRYNRYGRYPSIASVANIHQTHSEIRPYSAAEIPRTLPPSAFDKLNAQPTVQQGTVPVAVDPAAATIPFTSSTIVASRKMQDEDVNEHFGVTDYGLVCLGAIILFIGFVFFNGGASQGLSIAATYLAAEKAASNTLLAAMGGGLFTVLFLAIFVRRRWKTDRVAATTVARAWVAGMVAVASAANIYAPWAAVVVGILGAIGYLIWSRILFAARLDDPAEFFSIFCGAAISGIIAAAFLNIFNGILYNNATEGEILIWQVLSLGIIMGWTVVCSTIIWGFLRLIGVLRVGLKNEIVGYDYIDSARHLNYPDVYVQKMIKKNMI